MFVTAERKRTVYNRIKKVDCLNHKKSWGRKVSSVKKAVCRNLTAPQFNSVRLHEALLFTLLFTSVMYVKGSGGKPIETPAATAL